MVISFIIGLAAVAGFVVSVALIVKNSGHLSKRKNTEYYTAPKKSVIFIYIAAAVFAVLFAVVPFSIHTVNAGEIAVVKEWGKAIDTRMAGTYFDFWLSREYVVYDLTVQQEDITTMAYSSDAQTMDVEIVVQYQIQPERAIDIVNNYGGLSLLSNRIKSISTEKAKTVLSSKSAMSIIETRASLSPSIEALIKESVTNEYFVNIVTVVMTNIDFSDNFESTVEDKMIAEQEKLKAEYEKDKAIIEAEQELEVAKLAAQAAIATAEAKATSNLAIATAEAEAIKLKSVEIARMLGFTITEEQIEDKILYTIDFAGKTDEEIAVISNYLKYAEYLNAWDGKLPETLVSDGSASIILGGVTQ